MVPGLDIPEQIDGRYRVEALLGHGGMGAVLRAWDLLTQRPVALKILNLPFGGSERAHLHFQQEFAALRRLRHPNVPQVYEYGQLRAGLPYFTMELVEGQDLSGQVPLPLDRFYAVMIELAQTLAFVHSRRVVHRDIKATNVRIQEDAEGRVSRVILLDFGLVSPFESGGVRVMGTLSHLPPEAFHGGELGVRSDLYSLGVLMYEGLTGQLPRNLRSRGDGAQRVGSSYLDLSALSAFPTPLARLLRSMMAASPSLRPGSADAVVEVLGPLAGVRPRAPSAEMTRSYLASPALVGRAVQLQALRDAEQRCREGQLDVVLLSAVAGEGKTRLLDEVVLDVQVTGARVLRASCPADGRTPFGPLMDALGPVLAALASRRDPLLLELAPLLVRVSQTLAALLPEVTPAVPLADRDADLIRIVDALDNLVRSVAREELLLLVLDDLHWADSHTIDFVNRMLERRGSPCALLLLGAMRSDELHGAPGLEALVRRFAEVHLPLGPFDRQAVEELLRRQFAVEDPPHDLVTVLLSETGGNPYFLHEALRLLVDEGRISYAHGEWVLPQRADDLRLPPELGGIVSARLARCAPDARELAELLATAGRALDGALLRRVVPTSRPLAEAVQDLVDQDIVSWEVDDLRLAHAFMVERLRSGLAPERAADLHVRLAEAMLELRAQEPDRYPDAEIGRHLQLGGRLEQALPLLLAAGHRAHELQAQEEALRILGWAAEIQAQQRYFPGEGIDVTETALLRLLFTLDPAQCVALAERVMARLLGVGRVGSIYRWRPWLGGTAVKLALILTLLGLRRERPGLPTEHIRKFYSTLVLAAAYRTISMAWTGRFSEARQLFVDVVLPLLPGDRPELRAVGDAGMCVPLALPGHTAEATRRLEEVRRVLEGPAGEGLPPGERHLAIYGGVIIALAHLDATRGLPGAPERLQDGGLTRSPHHTLFLEASTVLVYAQHHALRGDLAQVEQQLGRLAQLRVTLRPQSIETVHRSLVWALLDAGHFDRARTLLDGMRHMGGYSEAWRCLLEARLPGPLPERILRLDRARTLAQDPAIQAPYLRIVADLIEAELRLAADDPRAATQRAEAAMALAQQAESRNEYCEAVAQRLLAQALVSRGDPRGRAAADRALQLGAALQNQLLLGLAELVLGRALVEDDPEAADEHLRTATERFERLGNDALVRRALELQRRYGQARTWSVVAGVAPGLDPNHLSLHQIARVTWSLDLADVAEGALTVLGEMSPGSRRWLVVAQSADNHELLVGQDPAGRALAGPVGLPVGLLERLRQAGPREPERLGEPPTWVLPLVPPGAPGAATAPLPPVGWAVVEPAPRANVSEAAMRELAQRVRGLAGPLNNALEHARLAQREYRLSMVNQLSRLLGSARSGGQIGVLVLDRMLDIVGADRAGLFLMDERGDLALEQVRDLGRQSVELPRITLEPELLEQALALEGVLHLEGVPPRLLPTPALDPRPGHALLVPLRSLLREGGADEEQARRRRDSLMTMSMPELTTFAQSETGGQVVGLVLLELDRPAEGSPAADAPLLTMLAGQAGMALDVARLDRQQEALKSQQAQLQRYLSKDIAEAVLADPELGVLGARKAVVTVVFTDVRGFTRWSESLPSDRVVATLNQIFSILTPILFRHGGTLDKYLGDGLMAIFGAPVERPDHAQQAVLAAREMMEALNAWMKGQEQAGSRVPGMGVGIHTGEVSVGNIGSEERMEYTAIGDVVNVGSRICGLAGPGQILVSESTLAAMPIGAFLTRRLELAQVKGRKDPVQLFEVL